jgi:hypothetical protein
MMKTDIWKTNDFVIGSPAYRMLIPDTTDEQLENKGLENPNNGWVLTNQIELSPKRAEGFLEFLASEEQTLILIAADEDRDVREAYAMVVDLLLECGRKKRELKKSRMRGKPTQK